MIPQPVKLSGQLDLRRSFAEIILGCKVESIPALAVDLGQVSGGNEPGIIRTRTLGVDSVTSPRLIPEDEPGGRVAPTLCPPLLLVVSEHEGGRTGALAVPLVTPPVLRPVVLVVARAAPTVSPVAFAGVSLEHHQIPARTGALATNLVAVTLAGVRGGGEVEVGLGAGVLGAEAHTVIALHQELPWPAGTWRELSIAGSGLLPVDIALLALTARPPSVVSEDLTWSTGSLAPELKALAQWFEVVGVAGVAATVCGLTAVVVGEERAQLTGAFSEVFIAELQWGVVVLVEEDRVTATVRFSSVGVPDEQVSLVTRALGVQLVTPLVSGPEHGPGLAQLTGDAERGVALHHQVLVHFTRASAELWNIN